MVVEGIEILAVTGLGVLVLLVNIFAIFTLAFCSIVKPCGARLPIELRVLNLLDSLKFL